MANLGWPSYRKMPQWPVPLEAARLHALLVLVDEPEQVDIQVLARPRRRAAVRRQALQQPVVEPLRVGRLGASVTVGGPADLPDDDGHVAVTYRHERRHQRVKVGLEHVGVRDAVVVHRRGGPVEEGEVEREVVVEVEAEERVDVDGEGRLALRQELDDVRHDAGDVGAEPARRRHGILGWGVVHIGVERYRGLEGVLDVLQSR
jgi:hypothetical protein